MEFNLICVDNVWLVNGLDVVFELGFVLINLIKIEDFEIVFEEMDFWSVSIVVKKLIIVRKFELEENLEDMIDVGGIDFKVIDVVINLILVENELMGESFEVLFLIFELEIFFMLYLVDFFILLDVYYDMSEEELLWCVLVGFLC